MNLGRYIQPTGTAPLVTGSVVTSLQLYPLVTWRDFTIVKNGQVMNCTKKIHWLEPKIPSSLLSDFIGDTAWQPHLVSVSFLSQTLESGWAKIRGRCAARASQVLDAECLQ